MPPRSTRKPAHAALSDEVRGIVMSAASGIEEGVKWNAPSFRTSEWFLTLQPRPAGALLLVFHQGARSKPGKDGLKERVADPAHLLQWRGTDRATIELKDLAALRLIAKALPALVRAWVKSLDA